MHTFVSKVRVVIYRNREALITTLVLAVLLWAGLRQVRGIDAATVYAGNQRELSVRSSLSHVKEISRRPHPVGSAEHARVRDYIVNELKKAGIQTEVQQSFYVRQDRNWSVASNVENILATLPGNANEKGVLFVAHYDSTPTSDGASDDGVAVGNFLEVLAALKAGAPLKNDLIFLFSDAEEIGSLGASAFIRSHSWAKKVGVVLNFEARGNAGATLMFETSHPDSWLVSQLSGLSQPPWTSSLLYEAYKRLPNDTDLTVFERDEYAGLNFAFVEGAPFYHTLSDNFEHVDSRTLEMNAVHILSLARKFGNATFADTNGKDQDVAYFFVPGPYLASYPLAWVMPSCFMLCVGLLSVGIVGIKKRILKTAPVLWGFAAFFLSLLLALAASLTITFYIRAFQPSYQLFIMGRPYSSAFYEAGFVCLTVSIIAGLYVWFRKRASNVNLWCGALLGCAVLLLPAGRYMPGASYILFVPLLFGTIGLALTLISDPSKNKKLYWAILIPCGASAIFILGPLIYIFLQALPLAMIGVPCFLVVLLAAFLLPYFKVFSSVSQWWPAGVSLLLFFGFTAAATATGGFNVQHPRPTNLFYAFNGDQNSAIWGSTNLQADEWTSQFFVGPRVQRRELREYVPAGRNQFLSIQAPVLLLPLPKAELVTEEMSHSTRVVTVAISSPRQAPLMDIQITPARRVLGMKINGKELLVSRSASGNVELICFAPPPEGIKLTLTLSRDPIGLMLTDQSFELPSSLLADKRPRPDYMIPTQYPFNYYGDGTFTRKSYNY